jgi:polyisoprenoid-binding protein YceI
MLLTCNDSFLDIHQFHACMALECRLENIMKLKLFATCLLFLASNTQASSELFDIDSVHTRIAFMVSHAGFSNPIGMFSGSTGQLQFDESNWSQSSVSVNIPLASLYLGDVHWQGKILDSTFFDAKKFPTASFVTQRIEKLSDNTGIAHGTLSMHGTSQPVDLNFTLNALKRHPLSFKRTIGFSATAVLSRKAFGMGAWGNLIGDEVKIIIELEAAHSKVEKKSEENSDDTK